MKIGELIGYIALLVIIIFFSSHEFSATGKVVQSVSMYCENGSCFEICMSDIDCIDLGYACCQKQGVNICLNEGDCLTKPVLEEPKSLVYTILYLFFTLVFVFLILRKIKFKKKRKKKR